MKKLSGWQMAQVFDVPEVNTQKTEGGITLLINYTGTDYQGFID